MTGPKALVLGLLAGILRVPAHALLGPETMQALDEIVKIGAAASVAYGAYKWLLRPAGAWLSAKAHAAAAYAQVARAMPEHVAADNERHAELLEVLGKVADRLDDGAELIARQAGAIERLERHVGLPSHRDAA